MLSCTRDAQETTQKVDSDTGHGTTASFAENIRPLGGKHQFVATEPAHNCQGICHRSLLCDVASAGADDYLCKPFSTREMVARIRQLIYRTGGVGFGEGGRKATPESGRFGFAGHIFDVHSMSLCKADGEEIPLTTLEYAVLKTLVTHARQVLSREFLLESVHSADWVGSDRNVDNLVSRIRKKLTSEDGTALVKTVRGAGYMFSVEVDAL